MADFDSTKTYFIKGASLKRLADIVREKIGQNVSMTLEQMGNYIYSLKTDTTVPTDGVLITGDASYLFIDDMGNDFIEVAGHRMYTDNLTDVSYMFKGSASLVSFPFTLNAIQPLNASGIFYNCRSLINVDDNIAGLQGLIKDMDYGFYSCRSLESVSGIDFDNSESHEYNYLFCDCRSLKEIGYLKNMKASHLLNMFEDCHSLREFPEIINFDASAMYDQDFVSSSGLTYTTRNEMFYNCYSLRSIPEDFLKKIYSQTNNHLGAHLANAFSGCHSLDEIRGLSPRTGTINGGMEFDFGTCDRIKEFIFDTQEDGTPYEVEWASQSLNLSEAGYGVTSVTTDGGKTYTKPMLDYNSGITTDKKVTNDATYQALKNDPDWYTDEVAYCRYNHDSAVNTINSLPDTSVYVSIMVDPDSSNPNYFKNYIVFDENQGSATDGGAIGNLTAEEIAVAVAKGWTVSFV